MGRSRTRGRRAVLIVVVAAGASVGGCTSGTGAAPGAGSTASPASASSSSPPTPTRGPVVSGSARGEVARSDGATPSAPAGAAAPTPGQSERTTLAAAGRELPRGGRELFPRYRLVGFSGAPGSAAFGRLGIGDLEDRAREIERQARPYARGREVLPVLELIASVTNASPGRDGMYRSRQSEETIRRYLATARRVDGLLLLNIQPGRADFLDEVKAYEKWLKEPDVGLALDPEWAVDQGQIPGRVYGNTSGRELDEVASYLEELVAQHDLPEKVLVFHQVAAKVVRGQDELGPHQGVALIKSVDGIGSKAMKTTTWKVLVRDLPGHIHPGFKLFYVEDARGPWRVMTPEEVLALRPTPDYVLYE